MTKQELTVLIAAILASQPRNEHVDNWAQVALHDALKLIDELEYHDELPEKECEWCKN